jgi:hypothetical protein
MPLSMMAEVRTNANRDAPNDEHISYVARFLGMRVFPFVFYDAEPNPPTVQGKYIDIGVRYALNWILERIDWMEEKKMHLTKDGSWYLSDEFLADIIVLRRYGFLKKLGGVPDDW